MNQLQPGSHDVTATAAPSPERTYTTIHMCVDIRGLLRRKDRELRGFILDDDGNAVSPPRARDMLMDELAKGRKVLPLTNPPCEGFSYETGCPGHREVSA